MLRDLDVNDIIVDNVPAIRERRAARLVSFLLRRFPPLTAIVISLQWRGNARVIRAEDAPPLLQLIEHCGKETAWRMALTSVFFLLHRDLQLVPMIAFDLNKMSDTDCRNRFRFDHDGIKRLVVVLHIPAARFVPKSQTADLLITRELSSAVIKNSTTSNTNPSKHLTG
ncbi:hypothetical protein PC116_g13207 [Phytophthora cactorum]|uniref:Uncharacterized protein n=1 Tax=Phytophthora cactorum TaxID=29920 RepID=A0A8T1FU87_9STRA|nr:hypothetical protein PC118_g10278 [Phytophthora cactorum]KAG4238761.1 hypothetical protein PC116_g13207 [Phytophthora cactorum]